MNRFTTAVAGLMTAEAQGRRPRCLMPWQSLMIDVHGVVQPCAYRGNYTNHSDRPVLGNINDSSLSEIWNGEEAQHMRRCMAAGDLAGAGCAKCLCIAQNQDLGLEFDLKAADAEDSAYTDNLATKVEEVLSGAEVCVSSPTVLYYTPDHRCNLACVHCYQNTVRKASIGDRSVEDEINDLLPVLSDVIAGGGEPLILPTWRRFIAGYRPETNPHLRFSTTTNATILRDDVLAGLQRFNRLSIVVSVDGATRETFEALRPPAKWDVVMENARRLRDVCVAKRESFSFNFSVMTGNIREIAAFIELCAEQKTPFNFQPVVAYPAAQSLRCFNDPVSEMKGWRTHIDAARRQVQKRLVPALKRASAEGMCVLDNKYETTTLGHIDALERLIPWDLADHDHRRYAARLPEHRREWLEAVESVAKSSRKGSAGSVVLFCSADRAASEPAMYYADIRPDLSFDISLPDGDWRLITIQNDCVVLGSAQAWQETVATTRHGELTIYRTGSGEVFCRVKGMPPGSTSTLFGLASREIRRRLGAILEPVRRVLASDGR